MPIVFVISDREDSTTPLKHHKQVVKDPASKVRSEDMLYTTIQKLGLSRLSGRRRIWLWSNRARAYSIFLEVRLRKLPVFICRR